MALESDKETLERFGQRIVNRIREEHEARGQKASGNFSKKLKHITRGVGPFVSLEVIDGAGYSRFLEYGRGPTKTETKGEPTLKERIRQWIDDKGITPEIKEGQDMSKAKDSLAFLIARKIHKEGTLLHGSKSGVLTKAITQGEIKSLFNTLAVKYNTLVTSEVIDEFKKPI